MSKTIKSKPLYALASVLYLSLVSVAHADISVLSEEWENSPSTDPQLADLLAIAAVPVLVIAVGAFFVIRKIRKNKSSQSQHQNETLSTQNTENHAE